MSAPVFEAARVDSTNPRWLRHRIAIELPGPMPSAFQRRAIAFVLLSSSAKVIVPCSSMIAGSSG
jgi:hypothetical protein